MEFDERVERELLEQCGQVATLVECFAWLQRCDECIERLKELCRAKRPRFAVGHRQSVVARIARLAGAKSQLERRFVHVGGGHASDEYASGNERSLVWREIDAAFEGRIVTGAVINFNHIEPRRFLEDAREIVLERVRDAVERHGRVKVNTAFNGEFATKDKCVIKSINTKNIEIYRCTDIRECVNKLNPMCAGCHVEVPREITTKRAVMRTTDNACFAWSVVAALYPAEKNTKRESSYPHYTAALNLASIEFPMILKGINKFERLNAMSINVYGIENKQVLPLRLTSDKKEKHINVLYLQDPRNDGIGHFAWIKNLSRLVSSQLSRQKNKKFFCDRCLHYFSTSVKLHSHTMDCRNINNCVIRQPNEDDKWLEFGNYNNKERVPFIVYADLQCVLQKMEPDKEDASYTYQRHKVCSVGYYMRCSYDNSLSSYQFRRDKDCISWFARQLNDLAHRVKDILTKLPF
ncbi:hypothetical protein ALC57_09637 [Trachymyrmex cornetzi]|uniref:C2H2-type domain-containing protein n=1 Tax=Trachymyrmex cornetzi TaxID=471704 RepID=A0A151J5F8_9HYME|nr:hypothetical protein ALC57_09637 [Trachymyrmex cornetzi]